MIHSFNYSELMEIVLKRRDQWDTSIVKELPSPYSLKQTTLLGSYSYTLLSTRQRIITKQDALRVNDGSLEKPIIETPSAVARHYLRLKYKRGPIIKHSQGVKLRDGLNTSPSYARPGTFEDGYYVDIKSTYWSIMQSIGWNVDYWPGKWLSSGTPPADFPFSDNKIARNCLVSAGIPGSIIRYNPLGVFDAVNPGNPLANVSLYRLINDVLNSIASQAMSLGAIYVNTDGYIAPDKKTAAKIIQLIYDWGLTPSIKAKGRGGIKSSGAYKVGDVISEPYKLRRDPVEVKSVHAPSYAAWLQKNFTFWVRENA